MRPCGMSVNALDTAVEVMGDSPADPVLLHLPARAFLAVEDVIGILDILLETFRHIPLSVVLSLRWRRDPTTR